MLMGDRGKQDIKLARSVAKISLSCKLLGSLGVATLTNLKYGVDSLSRTDVGILDLRCTSSVHLTCHKKQLQKQNNFPRGKLSWQ